MTVAANPSKPPPQPMHEHLVRSVRAAPHRPPDAAGEPPWPEIPRHENVQWEALMRFAGPLEAHIVAGRLNVEGVPLLATGELASRID